VAEKYFAKLKEFATSQENKLEAMRGLLRSQFQLQKWSDATDNAKELLAQKGIGTDDKVLTSWNGLMLAVMAEAARVLESGNSVSTSLARS
jgi:uncharacterized protein YyaL (SSP411 family)